MNDLLLSDPHHLRADLAMVHRALAGRWRIPTEKLERVTERVLELVEHPDPRVASKAIDCVVQIEALDQRDRHKLAELLTRPQPAPTYRQSNTLHLSVTSEDVYRHLTEGIPLEQLAAEREQLPAE